MFVCMCMCVHVHVCVGRHMCMLIKVVLCEAHTINNTTSKYVHKVNTS